MKHDIQRYTQEVVDITSDRKNTLFQQRWLLEEKVEEILEYGKQRILAQIAEQKRKDDMEELAKTPPL